MQLKYGYIQIVMLKRRRIKKKGEWREELVKERQHVELECSRSKCTNKLVYAQDKRREIRRKVGLQGRRRVELGCSLLLCTQKLDHAKRNERRIIKNGELRRKASRRTRMLVLTMYKKLQLYATNYKRKRESREKKRLRLLVF